MKKLLILMLVLGIASAANATLITWVDSGGNDISTITVTNGSTVTAYLKASDALQYTSDIWVGESYTASDYAKITNITATAAAGGDPAISDRSGTTPAYPGWFTIGAYDFTSPVTIAAGIQWNVTITGMAVGSTTTLGSDSYGTNDTLAVTVIPEPMTIGLLGLGGLFLVRRRK